MLKLNRREEEPLERPDILTKETIRSYYENGEEEVIPQLFIEGIYSGADGNVVYDMLKYVTEFNDLRLFERCVEALGKTDFLKEFIFNLIREYPPRNYFVWDIILAGLSTGVIDITMGNFVLFEYLIDENVEGLDEVAHELFSYTDNPENIAFNFYARAVNDCSTWEFERLLDLRFPVKDELFRFIINSSCLHKWNFCGELIHRDIYPKDEKTIKLLLNEDIGEFSKEKLLNYYKKRR